MARRPERRGTGDGKRLRTPNGSNTRLGAGGNGAVPGDNSHDAVMAHDAKVGGDMPRDTISGGSTPRNKRGAAMARSDGNAPRATSASTASPRVLFPPTKLLTDSEYALAARRARQRREAAEAEVASAAELVRKRCAKPTRSTAATGIEEGMSSATKRSIARNTQRLKEADANDAAVIVFKSCHYIDNTYKNKEGNETKQNQVKQNYNNYSSIEAQIGDSFRVP